jgi:hypothetical protein
MLVEVPTPKALLMVVVAKVEVPETTREVR